ncbi:MAG: hypothetical protein M5U15_14275 [Kiritimatiellae bacterium]|nr:hypothetical protein [Kiritimatiellia bacterium]
MRKKNILFVLMLLLAVMSLVGVYQANRITTTGDEKTRTVSTVDVLTAAEPVVIETLGNVPETPLAREEYLTVESVEPPVTAMAHITRADGSTLDLSAVDGEFERVTVDANEPLHIRLVLRGCDPSEPIRIDADNGGSLNRQVGPLTHFSDSASSEINFQYVTGGHPGRYPLAVSQGTRFELLDIYVGPERLSGQPGPARFLHGEERIEGEARL